MAISLKDLLTKEEKSSPQRQTDTQWVQANEKHRALQELLELELTKQRREEEAAQGVMDLVSGYGTPGQRAEQLFAPRPQLASALQQFGEQGATPSFTDFGSPGQAFAKMPGGKNIDLGMRGMQPTTPESLTGLSREIYRKGAGLTGQDPMELFKRQQAHDVDLYNRSVKDQAARDARLEKQQAQQTAENEKKALAREKEQTRKERAFFASSAEKVFMSNLHAEEMVHRQRLVQAEDAYNKELTEKGRARIAEHIKLIHKERAQEKRGRPSIRQHVQEALDQYDMIQSGTSPQRPQEDPGVAAVKQEFANFSPEDQAILDAYGLRPEEIAAEASKRNMTPEQVIAAFLKIKRGGKTT